VPVSFIAVRASMDVVLRQIDEFAKRFPLPSSQPTVVALVPPWCRSSGRGGRKGRFSRKKATTYPVYSASPKG